MNKKTLERACPACKSFEGDVLLQKNGLYFDDCILPLARVIVCCSQCKFIFCDAEYTRENLSAFYSQYYTYTHSLYRAQKPTWNLYVDRERPVVGSILAHVSEEEQNKNLIICDVGSGNGELLSEFTKAGCERTFGVEPSALERESHDPVPYSLVKSDIYDFSLNENADIITCTHVMEHLLTVTNAIQNMRDNLVDNGLLYIEVPNAEITDDQIFPVQTCIIEHINLFTPYQLCRLLESNGFSVVEVITCQPDFIPFHALGVIARKSTEASMVTVENTFDPQDIPNNSVSIRFGIDRELEDYMNTDRPVYIWGMTVVMAALWENSGLNKCNVVNVIDKSINKQGKSIGGVMVCDPSIIDTASENSAVVVGTLTQADSVVEELNAMNYSGKIIRELF